MPVIVGLGRTLIQFGWIMFVASLLVVGVFYAYGVPVPGPMRYAAALFPVVGLASGAAMLFGTIGRAFVPQIAQWAGYAYYMGLFLPAITGIASLVSMMVSMIPIPGFIGASITTSVSMICAFSMYYYIASRISGVPTE